MQYLQGSCVIEKSIDLLANSRRVKRPKGDNSMSEFKYPLELKSLADFAPSEIISTGYGVLDITFLNLMMQSEDGYGLAGNANNDDYLPSKALAAAGSSSLSTTDVDFLYVLSRQTFGEAWKFTIAANTGTWPTLADYDFFEFAVENYRLGLRLQPIRAIQQDCSTASTTLTHQINSCVWDDVGAGTSDRHTDVFKRYFYAMGIRDAVRFPELTESIPDSATQTSWNRISTIMCIGVITELIYHYIIGALQSDRFAWSLGAAQPGLLPSKVNTTELATTLDPIWLHFTKPLIHDSLAGNLTSDSYDGLANPYGCFDFSLIDLAAMEPFNQRLLVDFDVPVPSLDSARNMYGGGLWEVKERGNYETVHFANLLNLAEPSGSGYTAHGISTWYVGPNTAIGLDFLEDVRRFKSDFEQMLRRKHWTWFDVTKVFDNFWTPFNVTKSVSGFCDPAIYKAILRQFGGFDDSSKTFSNGMGYYSGGNNTSTGTNLLDSGVWFDGGAQDHENWWMHAIIWEGQEPRDVLYIGSEMTINELAYDFMFGLLYACEADDDEHKIVYYRQRYVEMIDFRDGSHFGFASPVTTVDIPRFECYTHYLETALLYMKYGVWIDNIGATVSRIYSAARPKGYVEKHPMRIERYGDIDVKIQLIQACTAVFGTNSVTSNSPVKITEEKKSAPPKGVAEKSPQTKEEKEPIVGKAVSTEPDGTKPPKVGGSDEDE